MILIVQNRSEGQHSVHKQSQGIVERKGRSLSGFWLSIVHLFLVLMNKGELLGDRKVAMEKEFK